MSLITPEFGLFFWMLLAFGLVVLILKKFAWKPILKGLSRREETIAEALNQAQKAREEIAQLEARHAAMEAEAQAERDRLVEQARETRERILREAKEAAELQAAHFLEAAREKMRHEEAEMRKNLRRDVTQFAMLAAERILRDKLATTEAQQKHIDKLVDEILTS